MVRKSKNLSVAPVVLRDGEYYEYHSEACLLPCLFNSLAMVLFGGIFIAAGFFARLSILSGHGTCTTNGREVPCEEMAWFPLIFVGVGALLAIGSVIANLLRYFESKTLVYYVFNDHLEYVDGFFNQEKKTIRLSDVADVFMKRSVIQRLYGIGTIRLALKGVDINVYGVKFHAKNQHSNYITIRDVKEPDLVYEEIKQLCQL